MHWVGVVSDRPISRRAFGITVLAGLLANCGKGDTSMKESPTVARARLYAEQHLPPERRDWLIRAAADVERQYTTAPVRMHYRGRIYDIPANFYTTTGRTRFQRFAVPGADRYEIRETGDSLGELFFFWPDFNGYTLDNWFDPFDRRVIKYVDFRLHAPDSQQPTTQQVFDNMKRNGLIEAEPSAELHGLKGYRENDQRAYLWVGTRANGELFTMSSFHPGEPGAVASLPNPTCRVRLFDAGTREEVMYVYSIDLFAHWREIDTRTQAAIQSWRVK